MEFIIVFLILIGGLTNRTYATGPGVVVTPEQFGAVGDCVADDNAAFIRMRNHLRAVQDAADPAPADLVINFGHGKCYKYSDHRWTWGLKRLKLIGNHSRFQKFMWYHAASAPGGYYPFVSNRGVLESTTLNSPTRASVDFGDLIKTSGSNATSVFTKTPSQAARYQPHQWVMVHSFSQQYASWPPNPRYFNYAKVISANPGTGEIKLDRPLASPHFAAWPEMPIVAKGIIPDGVTMSLGRARITPVGDSEIPFAEELYMENMTFLDNRDAVKPEDTGYDDPDFRFRQYFAILGVYKATLKNVTATSFVPSMAHSIEVRDSNFFISEVDKMLGSISFINTNVSNDLGPGGIFSCTGANQVMIHGGKIGNISCSPRFLIVRNATLETSVNYKRDAIIDFNEGYPTNYVEVKNTRFIGRGQAKIGLRAASVSNIPIDGVNATLGPLPNQVLIPIGPNDLRGQMFMRCLGSQSLLTRLYFTDTESVRVSGLQGEGEKFLAIFTAPFTVKLGSNQIVNCRSIAPDRVFMQGNILENISQEMSFK